MRNNRWRNGTKDKAVTPKGRPKRGLAFTDALHGKGTADELAELAWKAAREGAPWAIQLIYNRLEPQPAKVTLTHEANDENPIDYSRLTDEEVSLGKIA